MADSMVSSTVTLAIENLLHLLDEETSLPWGVKGKIRDLINKLKIVDNFLKSSEGKRKDEVVKEVVSQIRDVAPKAEDVIDTYIVNITKHKSLNMLGMCFNCTHHMLMLNEVNAQLEDIMVIIDEIYKNAVIYGIREDVEGVEEDAESLLWRTRRRHEEEEEEVVGLVYDSNVVIEKLKETDPHLNVVSIVGMGGLGKTTLARKIYNNDEVKDIFPCRAWGFVSYDYRARELFMSLLRCLGFSTDECKDLSQDNMKSKVRECLTEKKYLVVLDDIWKSQVWDEVQGAFPNDNFGSRILITSRIKEIALYSRSTLVHNLPFLEEGQSWELFRKKVFNGEKCPPELEHLGRTMIERCRGLPLAIVVLAGLVAKKDKSQREWLRIKNKLFDPEDDALVMDILKLSYDDLSQRLKLCFLYLGIYPEDYEIPVRELIQLWIAEGFIQPKDIGVSIALEDVADYYLDELVDRSLVEVASRRTDGGVKTCRVHDLLRDLCISEGEANKFMEVCTELDIGKCNPRRLSLHYKTKLFPTKYDRSHTRSLFFFGDKLDWDSKSSGWKWIRKSLKLVRVLSLGQVLFVSPPSGLKTLIHLRYLKLQANSKTSKRIFASMCNLWNLETLYIRQYPIDNDYVTLPREMWKMNRLRHLYFEDGVLGLPRPHISSRGEDSDSVLNLQTLSRVAVNPQIASALNNDSFPNLTKLSLFIKQGELSLQEQLRSLHRLIKLHTVKIYGGGNSDLPLDANVFPSNLIKITLLHFMDLDSRFINTLGQLANLQILKLRVGNISGSVYCVAGEFPQLEVLHMKAITVEGQWRQEKDAMPRCQAPILDECRYRDNQDQPWQDLVTISATPTAPLNFQLASLAATASS